MRPHVPATSVMAYFSNFKNGMGILHQVLTQLLLQYTRFQVGAAVVGVGGEAVRDASSSHGLIVIGCHTFRVCRTSSRPPGLMGRHHSLATSLA